MCKHKVTFTFEMAGLTLHTTLLFSYCNLHCALHNDDITLCKTFITASECSVEQHTFIAKLLSQVFRKVNDDITSYKINYNTIQNGFNSSFQVTGNDLCTVNSSVSGFLWLDKQSVRWFASEITSSLHRAIVLTIWRERERERERERGRERETSDLCLVTMEDHLPGLAEGERVGGANHTAIHQNTLSLKRTDQDWLTNKWQVLQNHLYNTV